MGDFGAGTDPIAVIVGAHMRFQRAAYLFNPVSGEGTRPSQIRQVRKLLLASAREVLLAPTEAPHHASSLAREAISRGSDLIVVQGGDGTDNEAVQGMVGSESAALAVLPGGTANVLAREVGLPQDPVDPAGILRTLAARTVRLGLLKSAGGGRRYFLAMCGAVLDPGDRCEDSRAAQASVRSGGVVAERHPARFPPIPQARRP